VSAHANRSGNARPEQIGLARQALLSESIDLAEALAGAWASNERAVDTSIAFTPKPGATRDVSWLWGNLAPLPNF